MPANSCARERVRKQRGHRPLLNGAGGRIGIAPGEYPTIE